MPYSFRSTSVKPGSGLCLVFCKIRPSGEALEDHYICLMLHWNGLRFTFLPLQHVAASTGVDISFEEETGPGYFAAVDADGKLQQTGWLKFPTLQYLGWAAQWLKYLQDLQTRLKQEALVIPVFESQAGKPFFPNPSC